jgi:hypothetical protein
MEVTASPRVRHKGNPERQATRQRRPESPETSMPSAPPAPNLLVVAIDRLPAWILPAYGATWVAMPTVTAWAAQGVVCDRLIALGSDASQTLGHLLGPLAARLPTAIVTDDAALAADVLGGEAAIERVPLRLGGVAGSAGDTNLARLCAAAAETIAAGGHRLVVVHATSLGQSWDAPDEFRETYLAPDDPPPPPGAAVPDFVATADTDPDLLVGLRHVFAGQMTLLDRCLAALGDLSGWTRLVCGVRGLGLGLHGRIGPGPMPPYGELVHLPAILVDAAGRMAGQRFGGLVTPADLAGLLATAAGLPAVAPGEPAGLHGAPGVADLFERWPTAGRDRIVTVAPTGVAVTTAGWQAVLPTGEPLRLYVKPDDYFEVSDVADRCPEVAGELGRLAAAAAAGDTETAWTAPLSEAARNGLA